MFTIRQRLITAAKRAWCVTVFCGCVLGGLFALDVSAQGDAVAQRIEEALPGVLEGERDALVVMLDDVSAELEAEWSTALGRHESETLVVKLAEIASDADAKLSRRRLAILALGEQRRIDSARTLIGLIAEDQPKEIQGLAYDALATLSYQPKLARTREAWSGWFADVRRVEAVQWQKTLHDNLLALHREQAEQRAQVAERLIQSQRALYRATAPDLQPALLVTMLKDPLAPVRMLAMDLARQRAEDNGDFGPELRSELRARLSDSVRSIREQSATLLGQLRDVDTAVLMTEILVIDAEQDKAVVRAMLTALAQLPQAEALGPAADWLRDPDLQASAALMLAAAQRAGLGEEAFWQGVRDDVRLALVDVKSPRPQMITLLGLVVGTDDADAWARIAGWLNAEDERVREAAARAWASADRPLETLAQRSDDPVIRPIALMAVAERGAKEQTLNAVAARRPDDPDDIRLWDQALTAVAKRVAPEALLKTIDKLAQDNGPTRTVREAMLTAAIERDDAPDPPTAPSLQLLLARARTRVLADAPALVVLDYEAALAHADKLSAAQRGRAQRELIAAYLADRRHEDALAATAALLKPEGTLIANAGDDPLIDTLIAAARTALRQGRAEDATTLVRGVRRLLGVSVSESRDTELLRLEAQVEAAAKAVELGPDNEPN